MIWNYLSHIHAISPPLLDIDIDAPPRLRIFFQSQNLVAIDQEVAACLFSREWNLQTTGNAGLLHKVTLWQVKNPELNGGSKEV